MASPEPARPYKGVYKNAGMWRARVWSVEHMDEIYLGHFADIKAAAKAYDIAAIKLKGIETAVLDGLNFDATQYQYVELLRSDTTLEELVDHLRTTGLPALS